MEGKGDLETSTARPSRGIPVKHENLDQLIVADASSDQSDDNNGKTPERLESTENHIIAEDEKTSPKATCIISVDSQEESEKPLSAEIESVEAVSPPQNTSSLNTQSATGRSCDSKRKSTTNVPVAKKQKQAQLNFSASTGLGPLSLKLKLGPKTLSTDTNSKASISFSDKAIAKSEDLMFSKMDNSVAGKTQSDLSQHKTEVAPKLFVKIPLKNLDEDIGNGVTILRENTSPEVILVPSSLKDSSAKSKKLTFKLKPNISRTTIIRDKGKLLRSNPGPFVSLNYDLYDDNFISDTSNETAAREPLAFGFPVENKPWLLDVTYIIAFLNMFNDIVQMSPLGPVDFEKGLVLAVESEEGSDTSLLETSSVSATMDLLFRKLLALVLNRKKAIARDGQRSALQELKSKYIDFGLPLEWRDDSNIHVTNSIPCDVTEDIVDDSRPQLSAEEAVEFEGPLELLNPFHETEFEKFGLGGINSSDDRCIMMRCMVNWCLSESTAIRQYLGDSLNRQDTSGERDTFYASRAILEGFSHSMEMKKDLQRKFSKKGKQGLPSGANETFPAYFDPTSDPLSHPLSFRFNEFIVGDCGFYIGRFYLVRMADPVSGRVSSLEQMRGSTKDRAGVRLSVTSSFALYVEDVHSVLVESLDEFGVEFDKDGNEVESNVRAEESRHWYSVASNCKELERFLVHLSNQLGLSEGIQGVILQNSVAYKTALRMYHYLSLLFPILLEYEHFRESSVVMSRASRRKKVAYTDQPALEVDVEEYLGAADDDYSEQEEQDDEYLD